MFWDPNVFFVRNRTVVATRRRRVRPSRSPSGGRVEKKGEEPTRKRKYVESDGEGEDDNRVEAKHVLYYGNSLGGILGSVYMALSPDVQIAALGVPGVSPSR